MKKKTKVYERTKKKLFDVFWKLYKSNDVSKITVRKICEVANNDRTTFYRYFFDIDDIFNQFEDNIINELRENIKTKENNTNHFTYEGFKRFNDKYGEYVIVFYDKGNRRFYLKFKELVKSDVYKYLNINIIDEEKKEFLYEFLFASIIVSYSYWYKNSKIMSLESFVNLVNNMIKHGSSLILNSMK